LAKEVLITPISGTKGEKRDKFRVILLVLELILQGGGITTEGSIHNRGVLSRAISGIKHNAANPGGGEKKGGASRGFEGQGVGGGNNNNQWSSGPARTCGPVFWPFN